MKLKTIEPWFFWLGRTAMGYIALFSLFWIPLGVHRMLMRQANWWHYPAAFVFVILAVLGTYCTPSYVWAGLAWPYLAFLCIDALTLWAWDLPKIPIINRFLNRIHAQTDHLKQLSDHYDLPGHLAMGIAIFFIFLLIVWKTHEI